MKNLRSTYGQFALITVFVSDFRTKATDIVDNLAHSRVRLIQAVLRTV